MSNLEEKHKITDFDRLGLIKKFLFAPFILTFSMSIIATRYFERQSILDFLFFQNQDQPGIRFTPSTPLVPIYGTHFFGDFIHVWSSIKVGQGEAYYGGSLILFEGLKYLRAGPAFLVFLISVLICLYSAKGFVYQYLSHHAIALYLVVPWPVLFAIDRGNIQALIQPIILLSALSLLLSIDDSSSSPRTWLVALVIGSAWSSKAYPIFSMIPLLAISVKGPFSRSDPPVRYFAASLFVLFVPALWHQRGIFYLLGGGASRAQYSSTEYFRENRQWNVSWFTLVDDFGLIPPQYFSILSIFLILLMSAITTLLIIFSEDKNRICVAFIVACLQVFTIPIAAPYTLGIFSLPILTYIFIRTLPGSESLVMTKLEVFVIIASAVFISPSIFPLPKLFGSGHGAFSAHYFPLLSLILFLTCVGNLFVSKRSSNLQSGSTMV